MRIQRTTKDYPSPFDLPHIGALCELVRETRKVERRDIEKFDGINPLDPSIIGRFEAHGRINRRNFWLYIQALKTRDVVPQRYKPLTDEQAAILQNLHANRSLKTMERLQCDLETIDFEDILPDNRNEELDQLVKMLEKGGEYYEYPALIMDNLWFDHAVNGTLCNLFGINPKSDFFYRWEAWHSLGIKFSNGSPVKKAYGVTDIELFPAILKVFYEDERTYPYLFTAQMRSLLKRLNTLPEVDEYEYSHYWEQVISFNVPRKYQSVPRFITHNRQALRFDVSNSFSKVVTVKSGKKVHYTIALWNPVGGDAERILKEIQDPNIYYAAQYDKKHEFHVNDWPETKAEIEKWDCE